MKKIVFITIFIACGGWLGCQFEKRQELVPESARPQLSGTEETPPQPPASLGYEQSPQTAPAPAEETAPTTRPLPETVPSTMPSDAATGY